MEADVTERAGRPGPDPRVTVVVPTYERPERLGPLTARLLGQTVADLEVIVVDDGSRDETPRLLDDLVADDGSGQLRTVSARHNRGAGAARNLGWRRARAPLVAFVDDDCLPARTWVEGLLAAFERGADVVQGRTVPAEPDWRARAVFAESVEVDGFDVWFEACNIAYRRELLVSLDGFDEAFTGATLGEDMDLGWRALESGAWVTFADDAVVVHEVRRSGPLGWLRARDRRATIPYLAGKHPRLLPDRSLGIFANRSHLRACLAALGAALAATPRAPWRARVLGGLLTAQYAHLRAREQPLPGRRRHRPLAIPVWLAGDLYETVVMARASVDEDLWLL